MADEKGYEVEFEFPDEKESKGQVATPEVDLEVEDDTPVADRGREPLPKELVDELEADELEEYSEKVKIRLKQMKKVWHDERRAKESAYREQQEAVTLAKRMMDENKKLRSTLSQGEKTLLDTFRNATNLELDVAKRAYKEAYDTGDADLIVEAQSKFNAVNYKLQQIQNYQPPLQAEEVDVNTESHRGQIPTPDAKTVAWQERNAWWGTDPEMTSLALGLHQKLEREHGKQYVGTDEYWGRVDKTMRQRFPEYFGESANEDVKTGTGGGKPSNRSDTRSANVVAPASRSTSAKRIVLKQSQVNIAKRLGITPEQYAREFLKLGNTNG